ncbi:TetR/AcrR family transcriptional regulator [uncultured Schumannella sp.]|uniref:TetR/AcrR family transcriptional regulator n=1 Tax=uncultured Schumannella sp. TaxID=1195956 RepID=UPI0025F758FD|nr:TetR/AcrR family transcriptional regulator [uncultured Schumannella sp.]
MSYIKLSDHQVDPAALIRNEPVQARSTARLAALLDAAAEVIDEIGYERLTTAMVAERAGASIGTVYRYFPDRIAVLQSLAARNAERMNERVMEAVRDEQHQDWVTALAASVAVLVDAYRTEPGFASLRLGDVLDLRPTTGVSANAALAQRIYESLVQRFELPGTDAARVAFEAACQAGDAIVARAFAREADGDEQFIAHSQDIFLALMSPHFDIPAHLAN